MWSNNKTTFYCYSLKQEIASLREQLSEADLENNNLKTIAVNAIKAKEELEEASKAELQKITNFYEADFRKYEEMINEKENKIKELRQLLDEN